METSRNSRVALGPVGLLLMILGIIFGTRIPYGPSGGDEKTRPSADGSILGQPGVSERGETSGPDFLHPYLEFREELPGVGSISACPVGTPASERLGKLLARGTHLTNASARNSWSVSVPDPIEGHGVGYMFDDITDAVQMAVEARGWDLDRYWLFRGGHRGRPLHQGER